MALYFVGRGKGASLFLFFLLLRISAWAQINPLTQCSATLDGDILTLQNKQIARTYKWNNGDLKSQSITDKTTGHTFTFKNDKADAVFPNAAPAQSVAGKLEIQEIAANPISGPYLQAECTAKLGALEVKRVFRIYPDCPAIACTFYLRGSISASWAGANMVAADMKNVESIAEGKKSYSPITVMEQLPLPGNNWRVKAVQFFDITDQNNNLIQEQNQILYRAESKLTGNLLFADEPLADHGLFILKESPAAEVQLGYHGFDFSVSATRVQAVGIGVQPTDITKDKWLRCYGFVTGVTAGGKLGRFMAVRTYQEKVRTHIPGRDDMILMNTWGDRSQDKHIGEAFTLKEIEAAHRLGITHFQIDDGWQTGRSANSAFAGGSLTNIWRNPDYWKADKVKFPNGLAPVIALGKKLSVKVCLWFNPSKDSSYARWRNDAEALIALHKQGINTFKIDGVQVIDKKGEVNLRKMFDTVMAVSNNRVVFNLDVTAGRRYGYHYFNEYGNIFLENRYTDWGNYYPHWTLRNLWMLSRYLPAQNLQIEFLNNTRNADKYPAGDVLAPQKLSFEYTFAITMMAQPLAWMEATGLPEKAFATAPVIKKYRSLQADIHRGQIFPIGNEPSGTGWTGFQSIKGNTGYLLVIREYNDAATVTLQTWLPSAKKIKLTPLLGSGTAKVITIDAEGKATFSLPMKNSYALYSYRVLNSK